MILAALHKVEKYYGDQTVLDDATLELRAGDRTALVGRNGAGKTTVLRLLLGHETPDGGSVFRRDDVTLGLLEQAPDLDESDTVLDLAGGAFADLDRLEGRLEALEAAGLDDPDLYARWEVLHATFERRGGYERRARRDGVLYALGFRGREDERVRHLSGGERTRLGLATLLMAQPDVLLLDEPTNHLDLEMRGWLEGHLRRYPGSALIVSHDRAFLDAACSATAEVEFGVLRTYPGNPSAYREARREQKRIEAATRANQEREHARISAAAAQMKQWAGQSAKLHRRAKSMERRADRYADDMVDAPTREGRTVRFRFGDAASSDLVLHAEHLSKRYDAPLFEDVSFTLRRGERIALVGPNGAGKTTFLRVLLGETASDDPRAVLRFGSRVRVGYYDQTLSGVDEDSTLIEELIRMVGDVEAHNLLGRFLFPYDAQYKRVRDLSGGERARLALLKLTLGAHSLLVLDEPTNHLDVEMIEALEDALGVYDGTLLVVSHDRRFLEAVTTRVWEVRGGTFRDYEGDFDYYRRRRAAEDAAEPEGAADERAGPDTDGEGADRGPSRWQLERDLEALEAEVARLEGALADLARRLADPAGLDPVELESLGRDHAEHERALIDAMASWEEASAALDAKR